LYKFPVGNLKFVFEKKGNDGKYALVFSLATVTYPGGDRCNASYTFRVYSIPTDDLEKLKI
jgi:hypothetical protein